MRKKNKNYSVKNVTEEKIWESENIFHLKSNVSRYGKFLAHYEIYKKILSVPGDIIECGVFKGVSLSASKVLCLDLFCFLFFASINIFRRSLAGISLR